MQSAKEVARRIKKKYRCHDCGKVVFEYLVDEVADQAPTKLLFDRNEGISINLPGEANVNISQCNGTIKVTTEDGKEYNTRCKRKYWLA